MIYNEVCIYIYICICICIYKAILYLKCPNIYSQNHENLRPTIRGLWEHKIPMSKGSIDSAGRCVADLPWRQSWVSAGSSSHWLASIAMLWASIFLQRLGGGWSSGRIYKRWQPIKVWGNKDSIGCFLEPFPCFFVVWQNHGLDIYEREKWVRYW